MNSLGRVRTKIERMERLLSEAKCELQKIAEDGKPPSRKNREEELIPDDGDLQIEFDRLYNDFIARRFKKVEHLITSKSGKYLKAFCSANRIPADTGRISKHALAEVIMQWMAQRKAITANATDRRNIKSDVLVDAEDAVGHPVEVG